MGTFFDVLVLTVQFLITSMLYKYRFYCAMKNNKVDIIYSPIFVLYSV